MAIRQWFATLISGQPHFVIGGHDDPYLLRWFVIPRNHRFNVYVHKFMRSDDDRALHDHPWWFVSIILRGGYIEHTPGGQRLRKAPSIAYRKAEHIHRVELFTEWFDGIGEREVPCWTLILTGPKARHWGFWCPKGFVPWEQFVAVTPGGNTVGRGCE